MSVEAYRMFGVEQLNCRNCIHSSKGDNGKAKCRFRFYMRESVVYPEVNYDDWCSNGRWVLSGAVRRVITREDYFYRSFRKVRKILACWKDEDEQQTV